MKKFFKNQKVWALALLVAFGVSAMSCSDDDDPVKPTVVTKNPMITATLKQYVKDVVVKTYYDLAVNAVALEKATTDLSTDAKVKAAADAWVKARKYWEQSEAFLFGAAADYGIDPHIDSWPLTLSSLESLLDSPKIMAEFNADYAGENLNGGLLGFHAVEYVLFRNGKARKVADIPEVEKTYAIGVAGDLARQTIRLYASWVGVDNMTGEASGWKKAYFEKIGEDDPIIEEPTIDYGARLENAGNDTQYPTQKSGIAEILSGAITIADEVGNAKITDPVKSGKALDVESWYSHNSLEDFQDNIRSIQNAYYGKVGATKATTNSVSMYVKGLNATLDGEIQAAITNAIAKIKAIGSNGKPFRDNLKNKAGTDAAIKACQTLQAKLEAAVTAVNK